MISLLLIASTAHADLKADYQQHLAGISHAFKVPVKLNTFDYDEKTLRVTANSSIAGAQLQDVLVLTQPMTATSTLTSLIALRSIAANGTQIVSGKVSFNAKGESDANYLIKKLPIDPITLHDATLTLQSDAKQTNFKGALQAKRVAYFDPKTSINLDQVSTTFTYQPGQAHMLALTSNWIVKKITGEGSTAGKRHPIFINSDEKVAIPNATFNISMQQMGALLDVRLPALKINNAHVAWDSSPLTVKLDANLQKGLTSKIQADSMVYTNGKEQNNIDLKGLLLSGFITDLSKPISSIGSTGKIDSLNIVSAKEGNVIDVKKSYLNVQYDVDTRRFMPLLMGAAMGGMPPKKEDMLQTLVGFRMIMSSEKTNVLNTDGIFNGDKLHFEARLDNNLKTDFNVVLDMNANDLKFVNQEKNVSFDQARIMYQIGFDRAHFDAMKVKYGTPKPSRFQPNAGLMGNYLRAVASMKDVEAEFKVSNLKLKNARKKIDAKLDDLSLTSKAQMYPLYGLGTTSYTLKGLSVAEGGKTIVALDSADLPFTIKPDDNNLQLNMGLNYKDLVVQDTKFGDLNTDITLDRVSKAGWALLTSAYRETQAELYDSTVRMTQTQAQNKRRGPQPLQNVKQQFISALQAAVADNPRLQGRALFATPHGPANITSSGEFKGDQLPKTWTEIENMSPAEYGKMTTLNANFITGQETFHKVMKDVFNITQKGMTDDERDNMLTTTLQQLLGGNIIVPKGDDYVSEFMYKLINNKFTPVLNGKPLSK